MEAEPSRIIMTLIDSVEKSGGKHFSLGLGIIPVVKNGWKRAYIDTPSPNICQWSLVPAARHLLTLVPCLDNHMQLHKPLAHTCAQAQVLHAHGLPAPMLRASSSVPRGAEWCQHGLALWGLWGQMDCCLELVALV